ncbi:Oxidoreductase AflY [Penicillium rolfsii]|nr:Oxidoreductase AflY [Penicillium rolfsii]
MMGNHKEINISTTVPATGTFQVQALAPEAAAKASEILQNNHNNYHIYIHDLGLHNHILHHILALYALGGTPAQLEQAYKLAMTSQRPSRRPDIQRVLDFQDPAKFKECLGQGTYYDDYLAFFQKEIDKHGAPNTVNKFLFGGDEIAEEMFRRFFSGFLHSPIHFGYAIEFNQPIIMAEALALTAVHDSHFGEVLKDIEAAAQASDGAASLINLQQEIYSNPRIRATMKYEYGIFQVRDGQLAHARDDFMQVMVRWKVTPENLQEKTAECLNSTVYWTSLAQRPAKQIRFDFFLMHSVTAGALWPAINSAPWISTKTKCRLLEWKGRADLILYCQTGAPCPEPAELVTYQPQIPSGWDEVFHRACEYEDDGHLAKLIRGVATTAQVSKEYSHKASFMLKSDREFLKIAHMIIDSAEQFNQDSADREREIICKKYSYAREMSIEIQRVTARWPRHVGFEQSWFHVPPRKSSGSSHL